jgi:hypothetical protein
MTIRKLLIAALLLGTSSANAEWSWSTLWYGSLKARNHEECIVEGDPYARTHKYVDIKQLCRYRYPCPSGLQYSYDACAVPPSVYQGRLIDQECMKKSEPYGTFEQMEYIEYLCTRTLEELESK